jgi:hypothetical protein
MHGTNNITSSMGIAWNKQHHLVYGHCMEQTTSLGLWALHGTNNITSSMGIARTSPSFVWIHDFHQNINKSSIICWIHDFHQNINKAPLQQQQVHPHFLDIITFAVKNFTALAIVGFWTRTQNKKQNKTNIQWMDLPFYAMQWQSTLSLCQYKYH